MGRKQNINTKDPTNKRGDKKKCHANNNSEKDTQRC
jgi:hypothetical protein